MPDQTKRTVLLVEDSAADREVVRRLLRQRTRAYTILEATTGEAGLAMCRDTPVDCVILDYYLSDMDGLQFLDALAAPTGKVPLPVTLLTARDDDATAAHALARGAQDYLVKQALTSHALGRAVENTIEKFRILRELEEQRAAIELRNHKLEVMRDELQAKVEDLADATKAKDRFLAVMSHEMRTPLNAILGYADLLDMELEGVLAEGQRQQVERIRVGSRHLLGLINDVLDLTRADARKLDLDMRPVDLPAVVEEVAALLQAQAEPRGIELVVEPCRTEIPHVQADLQRLRQILINIVGNALKFTDEGSVTIRCSVEPSGDTVEVSVTDTGIGIDVDILPLIFNEFYQAKGELTRRHGGTGLGLSISRRLAELMGGGIEVASTVGQGSVFTLRLRSSTAGSALRPEDVLDHDAAMAAHAAAARRVQLQRAVVAFSTEGDTLKDLSRRVHPRVRLAWTTDVDEVVPLAVREHASLVVLDIGTQGGAAWRAAMALKDLDELSDTAVLLLPTIPAASADDPVDALNLGWVSLVPKPFTAEQLTRAVSNAAATVAGEEYREVDVLVVDDDPDSRRVAAQFLSEAKVHVRESADGESALVEMRRRSPDVVVLDLMMPVLDGFGVLATMRADPVLSSVPVVVLTAKSLTEAERQFLSRSAVRVLQKGEYRLADVAALVLRAASGARGGSAVGAPRSESLEPA
ncbi:MAG TPA: response regulator [Gemmatimonadaceae bacterium]|nr:response regulator [Gemmatimonadaceae bacterium]